MSQILFSVLELQWGMREIFVLVMFMLWWGQIANKQVGKEEGREEDREQEREWEGEKRRDDSENDVS